MRVTTDCMGLGAGEARLFRRRFRGDSEARFDGGRRGVRDRARQDGRGHRCSDRRRRRATIRQSPTSASSSAIRSRTRRARRTAGRRSAFDSDIWVVEIEPGQETVEELISVAEA